MGLKSGSRDAGLDDADDEGEEDGGVANGTDDGAAREEAAESGDAADSTGTRERTDGDDGAAGRDGSSGTSDDDADPSDSRSTDGSTTDRSGGGSIPYKLRRDKVNDGREQVPYFLREEVVDAEDDLQDALEAMLGEDVYKSDYREASMVVAQRNPELVAEVLREWGYDYDFE